ncbi:hypothetical protein [uncultured Tessaracoccus sp.]|uniref:hypothetical protein n=1 Tax=uncultured Tessaracoccus sp. TaxID=905023 RepID=UPI00261925A2|nr:hypothetical protein [uncultured Tessaracoccus sp.]
MLAGSEARSDAPRVGVAWEFTHAVSPRPVVRVATVDSHGEVLNQYVSQRAITDDKPAQPWAVYLADTDRCFRLLAFDLDAKTTGSAAAAARDADTIAGLLDDAGLTAVVCESGPGGGRHVWTALAEPADPESVATLARLARHLCPTLDIAPLSNPATGCVRPPGAPHRSGGCSTVLSGDTRALTSPTGTRAQVIALVEHLAQLVDATAHTHTLDQHRPLPVDEHGRLYLPGPRRPLPAASAAALYEDAACGDASAVLWRVLLGAASARWRYTDIAALADHSPGLEHVRTWRDRGDRRPRTRTDAERVLRRQWDKAVRHVATSGRQIGDDPTFDARADAIAAHVRHIQTRADAAPGRWTRGGGPADRRILDALCLLGLQALQTCVEADIRRLALMTGIGRETARTALLRLADDGWITRAAAATGPHGATWSIDPHDSFHKDADRARSQADPRPEGAGAAERTTLLHTLTQRLHDATHDLFTPSPGLGPHAGNLYANTTTQPQTLSQLARATGESPEALNQVLTTLTAIGVLQRDHIGWRRGRTDQRDRAAQRLGVDGRLTQRAHRYALERELWAWWQAEETWMRSPKRLHPKHRPGPGQLALLPGIGTNTYGAHPRKADGRADYRAARTIIEGNQSSPMATVGGPSGRPQAAA